MPEPMTLDRELELVLGAVAAERYRQDWKWGRQKHPDGTGGVIDRAAAEVARERCEEAFRIGEGSWRHILAEEVAEAFAESDPVKLREELVQVAAVAVQWIGAIDRMSRR